MLITYCERCKNEVPNPLLSVQHKKEAMEYVRAGTILHVVKLLKENSYLDLKEAKILADHLCRKPDTCVRCGKEVLTKEYETFPACKAVNINWK